MSQSRKTFRETVRQSANPRLAGAFLAAHKESHRIPPPAAPAAGLPSDACHFLHLILQKMVLKVVQTSSLPI